MEQSATYKDAGVDLITGDDASAIMFQASKLTWPNRQGRIGEIGMDARSFSDLRFMKVTADGIVLGMNFDGVGTKIEIAERLGVHNSIAFDLFAMVCDDAAIRGAEPIVVGSILDCNAISLSIIRELAHGMVDAAAVSRVAVINGEVAELGGRVQGYGNYSYNWGAAVVWAALPERLITGKGVRSGDSVIAVRESGVRSNGLSLLRKVFTGAFGASWHSVSRNGRTLGEEVLAPSIIYTPLIVALTGGCAGEPSAEVSAMAHITGGGIPGKLKRALQASTKGARLDNLFAPPDVLLHCQELGSIADWEAYRTWNMGQGLLIVSHDADQILAVSAKLGFEATIAGCIQESSSIEILSRGWQGVTAEQWLSFPSV